MQIFIDESGNLGKSGRYFVISALVPQNTKRIKNLVKNCCVQYGVPGGTVLKELKGYDLGLPDRQDFLHRLISKTDFSVSYIVADKTHLVPRLLEDKNICYNYLAGHLLKPILRGASSNVEIFFDNHTTKVTSTNSLRDYIRIEAFTNWGFTNDLKITYHDSCTVKNLQAIDIISHTILGKYGYGNDHLYRIVEPHFVHRINFPHAKFGK